MWIRFVLVPGPFHQLGEHPWTELGLPCTLHGVRAPDQALRDDVRARFRSRGLLVS